MTHLRAWRSRSGTQALFVSSRAGAGGAILWRGIAGLLLRGVGRAAWRRCFASDDFFAGFGGIDFLLCATMRAWPALAGKLQRQIPTRRIRVARAGQARRGEQVQPLQLRTAKKNASAHCRDDWRNSNSFAEELMRPGNPEHAAQPTGEKPVALSVYHKSIYLSREFERKMVSKFVFQRAFLIRCARCVTMSWYLAETWLQGTPPTLPVMSVPTNCQLPVTMFT